MKEFEALLRPATEPKKMDEEVVQAAPEKLIGEPNVVAPVAPEAAKFESLLKVNPEPVASEEIPLVETPAMEAPEVITPAIAGPGPKPQVEAKVKGPEKFEDLLKPKTDYSAAAGRFVEAFYPSSKQEFGGLLQYLSNPDTRETLDLTDKKRSLFENALNLTGKISPALTGFNALGGLKDGFLYEIEEVPSVESMVSAGKEFFGMQGKDKEYIKGHKASNLRESIENFGKDIAEEGRVEVEEIARQNKTFMEEVIFTAGLSTLKFAINAAAAALFKVFNPGVIVGAAGLQEFGRAFDNGLEKTGDPVKAGNHAWMSMGFEAGTELQPARILLNGKNPIRERVLKFLAFDIGGENVAEVGQRFSEYLNGLEGEHTVGEIIDKVVDEAPEIMALTTAAAFLGSGTIITTGEGIRQLDKAVKTYKYKKAVGEMKQEYIDTVQQSLNEVLTSINLTSKSKEEANAKLRALSEMMGAEDIEVDSMISHLLKDDRTGSFFTSEIDDDKAFGMFDSLDPEGKTVAENFQAGKKVVFGAEKSDEAIQGLQKGIEDFKLQIMQTAKVRKNLETQVEEAGGLVGFADPAVMYDQIQDLKDVETIYNDKVKYNEAQIERYRIQKAVNKIVQEKMVPFMESLQAKYDDKMSIIFTDLSQQGILNSQERDHVLGSTSFVNEHKSLGTPAAYINLNTYLEGAKEGLQVDKQTGEVLNTPENARIMKKIEQGLLETVVHEYGHLTFKSLLQSLPPHVKEAMWKSYQKSLKETSSLNKLTEIIKARRGAIRFNSQYHSLKGWDDAKLKHPRKALFRALKDQEGGSGYGNGLDYTFSFTEFLAHEFERYFTGSKEGIKDLKPHFRQIAAVMERYARANKEAFKASEGTENFLKYLAAETRLESLQEQQKRLEQALEEAQLMDTPADIINHSLKTLLPKNRTSEDINEFGADGFGGNAKNGNFISDPGETNPQNNLDKFGKFMEQAYSLEQIAWANPHIVPLQNYLRAVQTWWASKTKWNVRANERLRDWYKLGKDPGERLSKFLLEVTVQSDEKGRALTFAELEEINNKKEHQLNDDAIALFDEIQQDFKDALGYDTSNPQGLYKVLLDDIKRTHGNNLAQMEIALRELDQDMRKLADRNFFPLSRFGKWTVVVKARTDMMLEGKTFREGDTVSFNTFESKKDRDNFHKKVLGEDSRFKVISSLLDDTQQSFMNIPAPFIKVLKKNLNLTAEQNDELNNIILDMSPAQRFKKHLMERKGTPGFSMDAQRGYASYFVSFSNSMAKMENKPFMEQAITDMELTITQAIGKEMNHDKRKQLIEYMKDHLDYVMNPKNELASLRAFGFLWHLGAVPKSAWVNLTQIPLIALPYLSVRKELGGRAMYDPRSNLAAGELMLAMISVSRLYSKKGALKNKLEQEMYIELQKRGIVDESLATELAGVAEGTVLTRMMPGGMFRGRKSVRTLRAVNEVGTFMFHHSEKLNRRITALAAYRLARRNKLTHEQAIEEAALAVDKTQYEYARWNRPKFMRGRRSVIFLFLQYVQNTLHFVTHDPAKFRALIILVAMAGVEGLPGGETLIELVNSLTNMYHKRFGKSGEKFDARAEARQLAIDMRMNPDLVMHGLGSEYGLGPLHLLSLAGVNVPKVDISGSVSMGSPIPGLREGLQAMQGARPEDALSKTAESAAGAVAAIPLNMYKAVADNDPDKWKQWERGLPTAVKNLSKAIRIASRGEETRRDGSTLIEYDMRNPQDKLSVIAMGASFQDPAMSKQRELEWREKELVNFYKTRRSQLVKQHVIARAADDREAIADVDKAIERYNKSIPDEIRRMNLNGKDLAEARNRYRKSVQANETGRRPGSRFNSVQESVREGYEFEDERIK